MTLFTNRKLIAVLRGIVEEEATAAAKIILDSGIDWLEVTTNSVNYLKSLKKMTDTFPDAMIGVGTVLTVEQVRSAYEGGAKFIVSPNCNPEVIMVTKELGMISAPGVLTPSEAFQALEAGADILKLFPVSWIGFQALKDLRAVLPPDTLVMAVGGVKMEHYDEVLSSQRAGFDGIGVGGDLYSAGQSLDTLKRKADAIVSAYDKIIF